MELASYLRHHRTGAATVTRLVRQRAADPAHAEWAPRLLLELEDEQDVVDGLLERTSGQAPLPERLAGLVGQAAVRMHLTTQRVVDDGLHDLLEFELVQTGIAGKAAMWRALGANADHPALAGVDYAALEARAGRQSSDVETARQRAAARVLAP